MLDNNRGTLCTIIICNYDILRYYDYIIMIGFVIMKQHSVTSI